MTTPAQLAAGSVFAGEYRVVRPLGEGGMGSVYVVEQLATGKARALKVMHPSFVADARMRERFVQEARVGARIESDHVVEVVGAGIDAATGMPWLSMELLKGETLSEAIEHRGPMARAEAREVFSQLGHALAAAHDAGVVHRDLKPENVFLAVPRREGAPFVLKVLDFGIAKIVAESGVQARSTATLGTPLWMAPEQAELGREIRPSADVWAMGLVAFYVLTGKAYWRAANAEAAGTVQLLREVLLDEMIAPSARAHELGVRTPLPAGFDAWFFRAVARDPAARFPDARAARNALDPVLAEPSTNATILYGEPPPIGARPIAATLIDTPAPAPTIAVATPSPIVPPRAPPPPPKSSSAPLVVGAALVVGAIAAVAYFAARSRSSESAPSIAPSSSASAPPSHGPDDLVPAHSPIAITFVVHRTAGDASSLRSSLVAAIAALARTDDAEVIAFDGSTTPVRVLPMGEALDDPPIGEGELGGGSTSAAGLAAALGAAKTDLAATPGEMRRHVVIVSDVDGSAFLAPAIDALVAAQTRVSVIVYGGVSSASPFASLAARGDGRFYAVVEKELRETLLLEIAAAIDDGPFVKPPPPPIVVTHPTTSGSIVTTSSPPANPCAQYTGNAYAAIKAKDYGCVRAMFYGACRAGTITRQQARALRHACLELADVACVQCATDAMFGD